MKKGGDEPEKTSICDGPDAMSTNRSVPLRGTADTTKRVSAPAAPHAERRGSAELFFNSAASSSLGMIACSGIAHFKNSYGERTRSAEMGGGALRHG